MRDVIAGLLVILFALMFLVPGLEYGVGSLNRPGAGGVPVVAAAIMIVLGLGILVGGLRHRLSEGQTISINLIRLRHIALVSAGIVGFSFSIERVGLIPATVIVVVLSALADPKSRPLPTLVLALFVPLLMWLIFKVGLQSTLPLFERPF